MGGCTHWLGRGRVLWLSPPLPPGVLPEPPGRGDVTASGVPLRADMAEEVRRCLTEVDSCFRLLLPFDFGPGLPAAPPGAAALEEGARDLGPEDEAQPCCSKTLCARARPPAAAVAGVPAQGAEDEDEDSDQEAFVRQHGLGSHKYTLDVELSSGQCPPAAARHLSLATARPGRPRTGPPRPRALGTRLRWAGSPKVG